MNRTSLDALLPYGTQVTLRAAAVSRSPRLRVNAMRAVIQRVKSASVEVPHPTPGLAATVDGPCSSGRVLTALALTVLLLFTTGRRADSVTDRQRVALPDRPHG